MKDGPQIDRDRSSIHDINADTVEKLTQIVSLATKAAIMECKSQSTNGHVVVGLSAVVGAIEPLVNMTGNPYGVGLTEGEPKLEHTYTPESVLFVSLLAASTIKADSPQNDGAIGGFSVAFGPDCIYRAMEMFELVTGKKPDPYMNPGLADLGREYAKREPTKASVPLAAFLMAEASRPRSSMH